MSISMSVGRSPQEGVRVVNGAYAKRPTPNSCSHGTGSETKLSAEVALIDGPVFC